MEAPGHVPSVPSPKSGTGSANNNVEKTRMMKCGKAVVENYGKDVQRSCNTIRKYIHI